MIMELILIFLVLTGSYTVFVLLVKKFKHIDTIDSAIVSANACIKEFVKKWLDTLKQTNTQPFLYPTLPTTINGYGNIILDKELLLSRLQFLNEYFESFYIVNFSNDKANNVWVLFLKVGYVKEKYKDNMETLRQIIRLKLENVYSRLPELYGIPLENLIYVCKLPEVDNEFVMQIGLSYSEIGDKYIESFKAREELSGMNSTPSHKSNDITEDSNDESGI